MKKLQNYLFYMLLAGLLAFSACDEVIEDDPSTDEREKFLGSWTTTETSTLYPNPITFTVTVENDDNSTQIRLYNIYQLGTNVYAYAIVTGSSFTMPEQSVNNMIIEGYGEMVNENTIELEYTVNDGSDLDQVTGEMKKNVPSLPVPAGPNLALK